MVYVEGQATTGYTPPFTPDIPRDTTTLRPAHRPWCRDCKRTLDAHELDEHGRCTKCARAAITRAAAAERDAARAAQLADLEARYQAETGTRRTRAPRRSAKTKLPKEGKQGQPTTRPQHDTGSAPGAKSASSTTGRAPVAGSSTHREKNPPAGTDSTTRTVPAGGPSDQGEKRATPPGDERRNDIRAKSTPDLDAQVDHITALLRRTHDDPRPAVKTMRRALIDTAEALHLLIELHYPQPHPSQSGPAAPSPVAGPTTSTAGPGKGKPGTAADTPRGRVYRSRLDPHADTVIARYAAGESLRAIGDTYGMTPVGVRDFLRTRGVAIRPRGGNHGNQHTRRSEQHPNPTGAAPA